MSTTYAAAATMTAAALIESGVTACQWREHALDRWWRTAWHIEDTKDGRVTLWDGRAEVSIPANVDVQARPIPRSAR